MNKERWQQLSLCDQMGNIGSEVGRTLKYDKIESEESRNTLNRAIELFDLTLCDPRWKERLREIARAKEVFLEAVIGNNIYGSRESLENYFNYYGICARNKIGA